MYKVSLVPVDKITAIWNKIEPLVDKVIPYTYGRMITADVLHSLIINHYHLWVIYKEQDDRKTDWGCTFWNSGCTDGSAACKEFCWCMFIFCL